jgi:hypothetical protein
MSWSLKVGTIRDGNGSLVSSGDLVLTGSSFGTVANEQKLVQDLRHWILTRMGDDFFHPNYGSFIDGGTAPDGRQVDSVIGEANWRMVQLEIAAEIRRIGGTYQRAQIDRARLDRDRYGKSTLTGGEILAAITSINFFPSEDALRVEVNIQSARNNAAALTLELPGVITTS